MFQYLFLSAVQRGRELLEDCMVKLSGYNPDYPRDRIIYLLEELHYDCFICINDDDPRKMIGAIAFNPDRAENIAKVFLVYVIPEFRKQRIASVMTAKFIIWAIELGFSGAQIGLGKSPEMIAVLKSINKWKRELLHEHFSHVEITPETGVVTFHLSRKLS